MMMSNDEIVRSFLEAKYRTKQVGILAELNACRKNDIIEILKQGGVDHRLLPRAKERDDGKEPSQSAKTTVLPNGEPMTATASEENGCGFNIHFSTEEIESIAWALKIALAEQKRVIKQIECALAEAGLILQRAKKIATFLSSDKKMEFRYYPRDEEIDKLSAKAIKMRDDLKNAENLLRELCGMACGEVKDE